MSEACENCVFFTPATTREIQRMATISSFFGDGVVSSDAPGACRRFPASVSKNPKDWCGEHKFLSA